MRNGYPLPDDIVAAGKMTDEDLAKLVLDGNVKASYFYIERAVLQSNNEQFNEKMRSSDGNNMNSFAGRYSMAKQNIEKSGSPFSGYILGKESASRKLPNAAMMSEYVGYAIANFLGDSRAIRLIPNGVPNDFSPHEFMSTFSSHARNVVINNPSAFSSSTNDLFPNSENLPLPPVRTWH